MRETWESERIFKRVKQLKDERHFSYYKLAKEACISVNTLYRWRDRKSSPTLYVLENVADALEVSLPYLLFDMEKLDSITTEQKELIEKWNHLSENNQKIVMNVIDSYIK